MSYGKPRGKSSHEIAKNPDTQKSQQPIPPSGSEPGRTSYWSANYEDRSTFIADAPANSPLAARLMKIAMQNQPNKYGKAEKNYQKRLEGKGQRPLTSQEEPVQQLGDITKSPPEVYRYEGDGKVTYHQKTAGGGLKISAPLGSQEAQAMDYAATKLCKPQRYHDIYDDDGQSQELISRGAKTGRRRR